MVASLAVVGREAVCEPSEQAEELESWWVCLELDLTCLRCRARKRGNGGGKAKSWHGVREIGQASPSPQPRLTGLRDTRRDEATPKTQPHATSCFSQYYTKVHTFYSPQSISYSIPSSVRAVFSAGPPPDIQGSLTFDTSSLARCHVLRMAVVSILCDG